MEICLPAVRFADMARKKTESVAVNLKMDKPLRDRLLRYCNEHPMQPTMTHIIETAVRRYLDEEQGEQAGGKHGKR